MTTYAGTWLPIATTQATAWDAISAIGAAFDAVGFGLTSDTGQITSAASITIPTTASALAAPTALGYQMRRLVSSHGFGTIYVRLDFFVYPSTSNTASTYRLLLRYTIGTGTNGAGVLSGTYTPSYTNYFNYLYMAASSISLTATRPFYVSSDGENYVSFCNDPVLSSGASGDAQSFVVERTRDPGTGTYTSAGFEIISPGNYAVAAAASDSGYYCGAAISVANSTVLMITDIPAQCPGYNLRSTSAATVYAYPISSFYPDPYGPITGAVAVMSSVATPGLTITTNMYGSDVTYIIAASCRGSILGGGYYTSTFAKIAFRYD
ncbi:hypothetical protein [Pseudoxanthomonas sp.]|uniref:hypothetical protein n=1 Tax=Pseudoxanthomonas sp. TaxID=1871049 RepID=UPI002633BD12|nr:hypothetical protein [Pseudoxanthomonas sp.]WDS36248.1 MAG: hypothetical protein O8I58_18585 [Pseudoxanthomonas sp.]